MTVLIMLETMTLDLSNVLEIRDDQDDRITLVLGPTDAASMLVLTHGDMQKMRAWLTEDHHRYLKYEAARAASTQNVSSQKPSPSTVTDPPF